MSAILRYESLPSGVLRTVGTVIWNDTSRRAVLIDPTDDPATFRTFLRERSLTLAAVLLTHGHVDHVAGACAIAREASLVPRLHHGDRQLFRELVKWGRSLRLSLAEPDLDPENLADGEIISIEDGFSLRVIHTPGHTPGQVAFLVDQLHLAIVGDTLFFGSVGRTDLPGGDQEQLVRSIRDKLYVLPNDTIVVPGHGPRTTIGREKKDNPFVKAC